MNRVAPSPKPRRPQDKGGAKNAYVIINTDDMKDVIFVPDRAGTITHGVHQSKYIDFEPAGI